MNTMSNTETRTVAFSSAKIDEALREITARLLDTDGFTVHYYDDDERKVAGASWIIIARDENVGTIQYNYIDGYKVMFEIKPSRDTGSSLLVWGGHDDLRAASVDTLVRAAYDATGNTYRNFATDAKGLPNHGWEHYAWAKSKLVQVIR